MKKVGMEESSQTLPEPTLGPTSGRTQLHPHFCVTIYRFLSILFLPSSPTHTVLFCFLQLPSLYTQHAPGRPIPQYSIAFQDMILDLLGVGEGGQ